MPDFYSEPGLHNGRSELSDFVTEHVDPLSGNLTLTHTDLVVPGNGGMDIRVVRHYNSNNVYVSRKTPLNLAPNLSQMLPRSPWGVGWTMHFGRVLKAKQGGIDGICATNQTDLNDDTTNNPVLELPGGGKQVLFVNSTSFNSTFITKSQWVADCQSSPNGLVVISPDGTKYFMDHYVQAFENGFTTATMRAWYTTRIEDRHGNYLNIDYWPETSRSNALVKTITSSDGTIVNFSYWDRGSPDKVRLYQVKANNQTWTYVYSASISGYTGYYHLTEVKQPDNLSWKYSYYNKSTGQAGDNILKTTTNPYGGTITYDYDYQCFDNAPGFGCSSVYNTFNTLVVKSKTTGGRDVTPGTWTYSYSPGAVEDVTTINFPGGKHVYRHFGSALMWGGPTFCGTKMWKIGLLKEKETYNGTVLINHEKYTWDSLYKISNEFFVRPPYDGRDIHHPNYNDCDVYAPVMVSKEIIRDGTSYTTDYSNFDSSYNPQTITENGQRLRITDVTYFPRNSSQNIVSLIKDESIRLTGNCVPSLTCQNNRDIIRTFDTNGNMTRHIRNGVQEDFAYWSTGELRNYIGGNGIVTNYNNHYRGIPRLVRNYINGTSVYYDITRVVNNTGTIASETNGRGYTTSYLYNGMNNPTLITPPQGSAIAINWTTTGRTVTRGAHSRATTYDGFGRISFENVNTIARDTNYDVLGNRSFVSYPGSVNGITYESDVIGRMTKLTHGNGDFSTFEYLSNNRFKKTNERSNITTEYYQSFGDPDNEDDKVLIQIDAPEGLTSTIARDILGNVKVITQGGLSRYYRYSFKNYLTEMTDPEVGTTIFGRDNAGNMTSRRVGGSGTTSFVYDRQNRLTAIYYPGSTPAVGQSYDNNNNMISQGSGTTSRLMTYDQNDNLISDALTFNGLTQTATYAYNNLDFLTTQTYPSGLVVDYAPDVLGRPTQVMPVASMVSYHPNNQLQSLLHANGVQTDITLNTRLLPSGLSVSGNRIDLSYSYDPAANLTAITDNLTSARNRTLTYDGLDRLASANGEWGSGSFIYDSLNNITRKIIGPYNLTYTYSSNRLNNISGSHAYTYSYDSYGNTTGNGIYTASYDDAGNLRSLTQGTVTENYLYDGNNYRLKKSSPTQVTNYFYSQKGKLLSERDSKGINKEFVYLDDRLIVTQSSNNGLDLSQNNIIDSQDIGVLMSKWGSTDVTADVTLDGTVDSQDLQLLLTQQGVVSTKNVHHHLDHLGSPILTTDDSAVTLWDEAYLPFGGRLYNQPAAQDNDRWYTGHVQDRLSGLSYALARYYDPVVGRFAEMDQANVDPGKLFSFNRYAYGNNNPYKYIDPDGNQSEDSTKKYAEESDKPNRWLRRLYNLLKATAKKFSDTFKSNPRSVPKAPVGIGKALGGAVISNGLIIIQPGGTRAGLRLTLRYYYNDYRAKGFIQNDLVSGFQKLFRSLLQSDDYTGAAKFLNQCKYQGCPRTNEELSSRELQSWDQ